MLQTGEGLIISVIGRGNVCHRGEEGRGFGGRGRCFSNTSPVIARGSPQWQGGNRATVGVGNGNCEGSNRGDRVVGVVAVERQAAEASSPESRRERLEASAARAQEISILFSCSWIFCSGLPW